MSGAIRAGQALVKLGLDTQRQEDAFARMTASVGVNGQALAAALEVASRGLVNVSDVMTTAASALGEGLSQEQLVRTMEIATAQAKLMGVTTTQAFNTITDALLRNTERGFVAARMYLDLGAAHRETAAALGTTVDRLTDAERRMSTYNAMVEHSADRVRALTDETLTASQEVERATTAWENFIERIGVGLVTALHQAAVETHQLTQAILPHIIAVDNAVKSWANWTLAMMGMKAVAAPIPAGEQFGPPSPPKVNPWAGIDAWAASTKRTTEDLSHTITAENAKLAREATSAAEKVAAEMARAGAKVAAIDAALAGMGDEFDGEILEAQINRVDQSLEAAYRQAEEIDTILASIPGDFDGAVLEEQWRRVERSLDRADTQARAIDEALDDITSGFDGDVLEATWRRQEASLDRAADSADQYRGALAIIGAQAVVLGTDFDAAGARISAMQGRLSELLRESEGEITPAIAALGTELRAALADQSLYQSIEAGFLTITDTASKMATGLIQGTLDIADAFKNLGQSLLANFTQYVIHQVFDPVLKAAASFVSSLISTLAGRAGVSLSGGLLGLLGSLFGGGASAAGAGSQTAGTLAVLAGDVSGSYASPGGTSTFSSLSNVASGLSTLYTAVAKFSGLPQLSTLVGTGVEAILSAAGLLGPGFVSLASTMSAIVAGIQTGTLSISAAFGFGGAAGVGAGAGGAWGAGAAGAGGAGSFLGASAGAWAGGASIASLYAFAIVGSLLEMLSIEERKFRRRQKDIQDEAFATATSDQLAALEQGSTTLTADIAGNLSVLGRMAAVVQNLAPLRTGEAWDIQEGANLGPGGITGAAIGMPGVGSREEAMAAAAASVQYITPFLESLAQLGIAQFQGEILPEQWAKADVAGGGFEAYITRWTAALKPYVDAMRQATAGTEGLTGEERDRAIALNTLRAQAALTATGINEVAKSLGVLPQQVPDFAAMLDEGQIREAAQIMTDRLFQSVHQAFMAEPVKIVQLLDIDALAREGEEAGDTILRLATALQGLDDMTTRLRDTAEDLRGETDLPARVARTVGDLQKTLDDAWSTFTSTLDPSVMLAAAETIEQATTARYQVEIDAATHLLGVIRSIAEGITQTANTIASNAPFLRQIGVDIRGATTSMIAFARSLPDAGARITALGGAVNLFVAQMRGALTGGGAAEQPLSAADYEAGIQAILHPPAGSAGDARTAAEIIEAEIQKLRLTIEGPSDVGRVQAEIAAMQAKLPALEAFIAQQESVRAGAIGAGGMTAGEKLLELVPNAQDLLQGIREGFSAALELIDPAERAGALNEVFSLLASGVGQIETLLTQSGLSAADQTAVMEQVLGAVGPLGEDIYTAMIAAAGEQAKAAAAAAEQLKEIIGPDYATAQNFIAARTGEMAEALTGLADKIVDGFEGILGTEMGRIIAAITAIPPPVVNVTVNATSAQGGQDYVRAGLYQLHEGERVLDPHTAAMSRSYTPRSEGGTGGGAPVTVTLQFGDVRVGSGGKDGAREFMSALRDEIRYGDLGAVIAKRVTGKG